MEPPSADADTRNVSDFDVYLYRDATDEHVWQGADRLERGFGSMSEAIAFARRQVAEGQYARAIVAQGEDAYDVYDTARDEALHTALPDARVAPLGPRSRPSGLAGRLAYA